VLGSIAGWAASNDASHITRPDTTGGQLARAIRQAMERAGVAPGQVDFISAHGTGTRYNDAMEMAAFQSLFSARPVFSVKGALGHTLGAAGLVEILISFRALSEHLVPPTIGLRQPEDCASGWATECPIPLDQSRVALTTNSGFGGINAALVLTRDFETNSDASAPPLSPPLSSGIGWITGTAYGLMRHGEIRADHRDNARIPGSVENGAPLKPFCDAAHSGQGSSFFKTQGGADAGLWDVAPSGLNLVPFGSVDALFRRKVERFGRFDPVSRMACLACELALQAAGYSPADRQEIGILGAGFEGSLAANAAYFKDYVESGRILARGNLFVYTLPTAALGEAAIHFGFQGPLFSLISRATPLADALEAASLLVKNGDAPAMLVVQAEAESAVAALVTADSAPLLSLLATLAASTPRLSQLIPLLAAHTKNPGQ
jgi:3-oxoacyl-(acyl-carrier-protein) synthase